MEKNTKEYLYDLYDRVNEYGHYYHDLDSPLIADEIYDALIREIEETEAAHPEWKREDSPTAHVSGMAAKTGLGKVEHPEPMQSLEDKFSGAEIEDWYKNAGFANMDMGNPAFDAETKVDGLSVALEYRDGVFLRGSTRGDGRVGEDVTENIKKVRGIPFDLRKKLKELGVESEGTVLRVRAEVVMFNKEFERVNKEREQNGEPLYANPRNAAAGTLRVINPELVKQRGLEAIAFAIMYSDGFDGLSDEIRPGNTQTADLSLVSKLGFNTVFYEECNTTDEILSAIDKIDAKKAELPYWIDGAVIKVNSVKIQNQLGTTAKYPKWAVAYKYVPEEKTTKVKQIIVQTGRTGILTPKVEFEPVNLAGTTVRFATLHNPGQIKALGGIAPGDEIDVNKAAEIIPQVIRVHTDRRDKNAQLFEIKECPTCGATAEIVTKDGIETAYCPNPNCPAKKQKYFEFAVSRGVLNIVGMGPALIELFITRGYLKGLPDIYRLSDYAEEMTKIKKLGKTSVNKLMASIEESKGRSLSRVFAALGIKGCGTFVGDILEEKCSDIWEISKMTREELSAMDGIGDITASEMVNYFANKDNLEMLKELEDLGVNLKSAEKISGSENKSLEGLTIVITGTLEKYTRKDAESLIKINGGRVTGSVSKQTDYLLAGEAAGSKLNKAVNLGVKVIDETEFEKMISGDYAQN